jgi:hypothetical protein
LRENLVKVTTWGYELLNYQHQSIIRACPELKKLISYLAVVSNHRVALFAESGTVSTFSLGPSNTRRGNKKLPPPAKRDRISWSPMLSLNNVGSLSANIPGCWLSKNCRVRFRNWLLHAGRRLDDLWRMTSLQDIQSFLGVEEGGPSRFNRSPIGLLWIELGRKHTPSSRSE